MVCVVRNNLDESGRVVADGDLADGNVVLDGDVAGGDVVNDDMVDGFIQIAGCCGKKEQFKCFGQAS